METDYNVKLLVLAPLAMVVVAVVRRFFDLPQRLPDWNRWLSRLWVPAAAAFAGTALFHYPSGLLDDAYWLFVLGALGALLLRLGPYLPARTALLGLAPVVLEYLVALGLAMGNNRLVEPYAGVFVFWGRVDTLWLVAMLLLARHQKKTLQRAHLLREEEEKARRLIAAQNVELERLVAERTAALTRQAAELGEALTELRATQAQLIQREKMASLGELTAGIAHEIQNPLNFVNNFADLSAELVAELEEERTRAARDAGLEAALLRDLQQNLQLIARHGDRAASIVRGMLEHSRSSTGERQPTDLNALCDEYLRLAYHGLRAKDKSFNATLKTDFAPALPLVEAVGPDLGRVLLNLFNNAFYAVQKRQQGGAAGYVPTVSVRTRALAAAVEVQVRDNGTGIAAHIKAKIFQPFFTTKPAGEGTGLGLSLSYDIVTQGHGGTLAVESREGEGTEFIVALPR